MERAIQLAQLGEGYVAPNPLVGAVLVYEDRIIGEGYHKKYGEAHAEVNCIESVLDKDKHLIPISTLYVTLEPCAHHGKTPPCVDLILRHNIKKVVIALEDPFHLVGGAGIKKLQNNNIEVVTGIFENEARFQNRKFLTNILKKRPYITLKWAQSQDAYIGKKDERILLSNLLSHQHAHALRATHDAILIGKNTAIIDNPSLNTRFFPGASPKIILIDPTLQVPPRSKLFSAEQAIYVINNLKESVEGHIHFLRFSQDEFDINSLTKRLFDKGIHSILVEGGSFTLQRFIQSNSWDEAFIYKCPQILGSGIAAPHIEGRTIKISHLHDNQIQQICSF